MYGKYPVYIPTTAHKHLWVYIPVRNHKCGCDDPVPIPPITCTYSM